MKYLFYTFTLCLLLQEVKSQQSFNCNSHEYFQKQMETNPSFKKSQQQLEKETEYYLQHKGALKASAAPAFIIPVVFHVIYTTNAGNISDAQIVDQINILNQEFNRLQPDTALTPVPFKSLATPFSVEFRLATIDPSGNCTNGINRIYSTLSNCSFEEDAVKALSVWPSNKYLNIWIVQSMHYSSSMDCVGGGYATFPGGSAALDGINIRGDLISNIGTAAGNSQWGNFKGRYLIHELGHWFNLRHIWGDANCGNDLVADTPPHVTSNSGCPTFPRNPSSTCAGSNANGEMYTDYMDYTNGPCLNMFSAGQVARMTACMNSSASGRNNLWTNSNLNATGTNNSYTYPIACTANPAILPYGKIVVCKGDSVKFTDNSYGGSATSRSWSFQGGSASSLTDSIVKVKYNTPGTYSVELTKTYQSTTKAATFIDKVQVLDNVPNVNYSYPFNDSFEDPSLFDSDWTIVNTDNDPTKWELTYSSAYSGANCVMVNNYGKEAPLTDELISPPYDLSAVSNPTLTFRLHFANKITANYDRLITYISNNCGKTWQQIYTRAASATLNTVPGNIATSYTPGFGSDDDWRLEKVNILNSWAGGIVRFKFVFISGGGNNLFLDDINVNGISTVGVTANTEDVRLSVFPNPARNTIQIKLSAGQKNVQIEIVDVLGKVCLSQNISEIKDNYIELDIQTLKQGVYFIRLKQVNGKAYTTKFIKQSGE